MPEWQGTPDGTLNGPALSDSQIPDNTAAIAAHAATMAALARIADARLKFHESVGQADALIGLVTAVTNVVGTLAPLLAPHAPAISPLSGGTQVVGLIGDALGTTNPEAFIRDALGRLLGKA